MQWCSALSEASDSEVAIAEAAAIIDAALGADSAGLAVVATTPHHAAAWSQLPAMVRKALPNALLVGASSTGVIGEGHEVEQRRGLSITAASLPDVQLKGFHIDAGALPARDDPASRWIDLVGVDPALKPHFLLMPDPLTCDVEHLLRGMDLAYPNAVKVGGNGSGGALPGANAIFCGDRTHHVGVVGVAMSGNVAVDTVVAQGCRPIGQPMLITRCHGNLVQELNGEAPVHVLRQLYASLAPRDRRLFRNSLFAGIEMSEEREEYQQGDFLIRNITGMDPEDGAVSIGALATQWQVLQFHLRDARTSTEDVTEMLRRYVKSSPPVSGALLFSCVGRGLNLYGRPDHDTDIFHEFLPKVPLGGFFCNGELGPVDGRAFLHGYTSVFALFRPVHVNN